MFNTINNTFHWVDIFISVLYIFIIIIVSLFIKRRFIEDKPEYKYFTWALITKMLGATAFASVYIFYYGGGDTMYYFGGAKTLSNIFIDHPAEYFKLLFSSNNFSPELAYIKGSIVYAQSPEEWFTVRLVSLYSFWGFNRFWLVTIVTSVITFYGNWKFYQSFLLFFPERRKIAFWSVFLVPNVIFWGSGILKDAFVFSALGILLYTFIQLFFYYNFKFKYILALLLSLFIIVNIKVYVLICLLPCLLLGWVFFNRNKIKNKLLKILFTPIVVIGSILLAALLVNVLMSDSEKYKAEGLEKRAEGFHTWHTAVGGSSYNLGKMEYTPLGVVKKIPVALNVTYFRPDFTEITNITTAIGGLESFVVLILFILMLFRYRLRWLRECFANSFLLIGLSFSLVLGFIVGYTSYNFGALARYKIPVMPFFVFILLHFNALYKENKEEQQKET